MTDWDYILTLRNQSYDNFYLQDKPLTKKEHYAYLKKQKTNPKFFNWIISKNEKDVGYVRLLDEDVSIMIEKKYQGQGIGTLALQILEKEARNLGVKRLVGRVMVDNERSKQIFLNNDYKLKMYWFEKNI